MCLHPVLALGDPVDAMGPHRPHLKETNSYFRLPSTPKKPRASVDYVAQFLKFGSFEALACGSTAIATNNGTVTTIVSKQPECYVEDSFMARQKWLEGDGFIMIHHIRRAGGSTLCGLLAEDDNPLRDSNCMLVFKDGRYPNQA
eukprot:6581305-Ditylum_brightwellii.AAC.1